jgi:uncharacterized protein YndB with AHSA1/START domain
MTIASKETKILIERSYPAPVSELWDLWTTKEGFESWWGPQGFRVEVTTLEAKKDGVLKYMMIADSPEMIQAMRSQGQPIAHGVRSTFSVWEPQRSLTLSNLIDFLPGVTPYLSDIEVTFTQLSHGTNMIVALSAMHDAQFTEMQQAGFKSQLSKLDRLYLPQAPPQESQPAPCR